MTNLQIIANARSNSLKQAQHVADPRNTIKYMALGTDGRIAPATSKATIDRNVPSCFRNAIDSAPGLRLGLAALTPLLLFSERRTTNTMTEVTSIATSGMNHIKSSG